MAQRSVANRSERHLASAGSGTYPSVRGQKVLEHPHPALEVVASAVDPTAASTVELAMSLVAAMRAAKGCVGLSAPQLGASVRLFCVDVTGHKKTESCSGLIVMANPRVVDASGEVVMREGCLSVPDFTGDVRRAESVRVEGFEPGTGSRIEIRANAIEARCVLHEIDHLDGILFVTRVEDPVRDLFRRKKYA
jgi:peptide deformylase